MKSVSFHVPGDAVGKARPRVTTAGGFARAYTPLKSANYERLVALACRYAMRGAEPIAGPVELRIAIGCRVAQCWSKKSRADALAGLIAPITKPDVDNVAKSIADAMNGIAYHDDSQIVSLAATKRYSPEPGVTVQVVSLMETQ